MYYPVHPLVGSTVRKAIFESSDNDFQYYHFMTTRNMRKGEEEAASDYFFRQNEFEAGLKQARCYEYADSVGNMVHTTFLCRRDF